MQNIFVTINFVIAFFNEIFYFRILDIMGIQCFQESAVKEVIGLFLPAISACKTKADGNVIVVINK